MQLTLTRKACRKSFIINLVIDLNFVSRQAASLVVGIKLSLSLLRDTLSLKLLEKGNSFTNLDIETCEIVEVGFNFLNGEVNKHTSNLRGMRITNELFDVGINELSYHLF